MICNNSRDYQDFGVYIPMMREGSNGPISLFGNMGIGRAGKGYYGYNGAYSGQGNYGGGWPMYFEPDFIPYDSYSSCARCGYFLEDTRFG